MDTGKDSAGKRKGTAGKSVPVIKEDGLPDKTEEPPVPAADTTGEPGGSPGRDALGAVVGVFKRIHYNSPLILTYALLSLGALLIGMASEDIRHAVFSVHRGPLDSPFTYIGLFGYAFGHVNVEHYFNNFLIMLLIGPPLEEKYGVKKLLPMMLIAAVLTGGVHMLLSPDTRLMGASGIVFMFIILSSFVNLSEGRIPLTLILCVIVFIGREVFSGIQMEDNISRITHIIGGVFGILFGALLNREKLFKKKNLPEQEPEKPEPEADPKKIIDMTERPKMK